MWLPSKRSCNVGGALVNVGRIAHALQADAAFDSDGNVCTPLTSGDRTTIGAGLGLCALWLDAGTTRSVQRG